MRPSSSSFRLPRRRKTFLAAVFLLFGSVVIVFFSLHPHLGSLKTSGINPTHTKSHSFELAALGGRLVLVVQFGQMGTAGASTNTLSEDDHFFFGGMAYDSGWTQFKELMLTEGRGISFPGASITSLADKWSTGHSSNVIPGAARPTLSRTLYALTLHAAYPFAFGLLLLVFCRRRPTGDTPIRACPVCHYDLRSTPDPAGPALATCPECGHPPNPLQSRPASSSPKTRP